MQDWYYYPHFTNKHKVTWSQDLNRGLNEYKVHPFSLQKFVCQLYAKHCAGYQGYEEQPQGTHSLAAKPGT